LAERTIILKRLNDVAPWLSVLLLAGLALTLPTSTVADGSAEVRSAEVAYAVAEVPWLIGRWVGEDAPVPREAQKLLRPNSILSRVYRTPRGPQVHVLLVHCGDARDMRGHYPPICYPSSGYVSVQPGIGADVVLTAAGCEIPVQTYAFERMRDRTHVERIRVFNAFILPDGSVSRNIDDINRQSERAPIASLGVAQLQVITPSDFTLDEAVAAGNEILGGMPELLEALRVKEREDTEQRQEASRHQGITPAIGEAKLRTGLLDASMPHPLMPAVIFWSLR
jgi:hypothetical protein